MLLYITDPLYTQDVIFCDAMTFRNATCEFDWLRHSLDWILTGFQLHNVMDSHIVLLSFDLKLPRLDDLKCHLPRTLLLDYSCLRLHCSVAVRRSAVVCLLVYQQEIVQVNRESAFFGAKYNVIEMPFLPPHPPPTQIIHVVTSLRNTQY